jgi:DNA-binding PadR family transcriptional regulator
MFGRHFREFHDFHESRLFEKGDLKYVILDLLKDKPRHGYEIIRELEARFHGLYSPSAGSVYPTLQLLEDMDYVNPAEQDGKKVYTITDEGKKFIGERGDVMAKIQGNMRDWWGWADREELRETVYEFRNIVRMLRGRLRHLDAEKLTKIRDIARRAGKEIEAVLNG